MRNWEWNITNENGSIQNACTLVLYIYNFIYFFLPLPPYSCLVYPLELMSPLFLICYCVSGRVLKDRI